MWDQGGCVYEDGLAGVPPGPEVDFGIVLLEPDALVLVEFELPVELFDGTGG